MLADGWLCMDLSLLNTENTQRFPFYSDSSGIVVFSPQDTGKSPFALSGATLSSQTSTCTTSPHPHKWVPWFGCRRSLIQLSSIKNKARNRAPSPNLHLNSILWCVARHRRSSRPPGECDCFPLHTFNAWHCGSNASLLLLR